MWVWAESLSGLLVTLTIVFLVAGPAVGQEAPSEANPYGFSVLHRADFLKLRPEPIDGPCESGRVSHDESTVAYRSAPAVDGCAEMHVPLIVPPHAMGLGTAFDVRSEIPPSYGWYEVDGRLRVYHGPAVVGELLADEAVLATNPFWTDVGRYETEIPMEGVEGQVQVSYWFHSSSGTGAGTGTRPPRISPSPAAENVLSVYGQPEVWWRTRAENIRVGETISTNTPDGKEVVWQTHLLDVTVQPEYATVLEFTVPASLGFAYVRAPGGEPVQEAERRVVDAGDSERVRYRVEVPEGRSGTYEVVFTFFGAPSWLTFRPALLTSGLLLGLPLGLSGVATTYRYRQPRQTRTSAHMFFTGLALAGVVYLGVLAWGTVIRPNLFLRTWPPVGPSILAVVLLVLVSLLLIVINVRQRSRHARHLTSDLAVTRATEAETRRRATDLEALAYGISHDLKTPILALDWLTTDLEEELHQAGHAGRFESIERIRKSVGGMERLVNDLLELTRIERGELRHESVDLGKTFHEVCETLQEVLERREVVLEVGRLPVVDGDPSMLRQLFHNLVHNAVKYGPSIDPKIQIEAEETDEGVHVHVDDNGPGIREAHRETIFALLARNPDERREIDGTGIGLALVRRIAQRHGGDVTVSDSPMGGARFTLFLPVQP